MNNKPCKVCEKGQMTVFYPEFIGPFHSSDADMKTGNLMEWVGDYGIFPISSKKLVYHHPYQNVCNLDLFLMFNIYDQRTATC